MCLALTGRIGCPSAIVTGSHGLICILQDDQDRRIPLGWTVVRSELHVDYLELLTLYLALRHFFLLLSWQLVLVRTDSASVVAYITLARSLFLGSSAHIHSLRATHVPGCLKWAWPPRGPI